MAGDEAFARLFGATPAINVTGAAPDYFCRHLKNLPEADDVMPCCCRVHSVSAWFIAPSCKKR